MFIWMSFFSISLFLSISQWDISECAQKPWNSLFFVIHYNVRSRILESAKRSKEKLQHETKIHFLLEIDNIDGIVCDLSDCPRFILLLKTYLVFCFISKSFLVWFDRFLLLFHITHSNRVACAIFYPKICFHAKNACSKLMNRTCFSRKEFNLLFAISVLWTITSRCSLACLFYAKYHFLNYSIFDSLGKKSRTKNDEMFLELGNSECVQIKGVEIKYTWEYNAYVCLLKIDIFLTFLLLGK